MARRAAGLGVPGLAALTGALAAALPAFLGGCATVTPSAAPPPAGPAALADRLPTVAAGFRRGEARPAGRAGEGREVAYATGGGRHTAAATVELLAEDIGAEAALDATVADATRAVSAREVREAGRFTVAPAGGAASPLFCARTAGRYGRERVAGLVCAGRAGGALLRLRVAMPAREPPLADSRAFAEAIAATLPGGPAAAAAPSG